MNQSRKKRLGFLRKGKRGGFKGGFFLKNFKFMFGECLGNLNVVLCLFQISSFFHIEVPIKNNPAS